MARLRMAVVGVGALGRHHARILSEQSHVELVAVADSHADRGQDIARKCHCRWVADYRELAGQVDAVSVVVPTTAHLQVAGFFLDLGIPVLVEKPLAATVAEARQLADRSRQTTLQVGHIERFNPAYRVAAPLCAHAKYIRAERVSTYTFRSTDIGVVLDLMIHDIDLVLSLSGSSQVTRVEAFGIGVMGGHEDAAQARLFFDNGCVADIVASRINPTPARSLQIWSPTGCVNVDLHQRTVTRFAPSERLQHGAPPVDLARQPGADVEQLKKEVFTSFVRQESLSVPAGDALTEELRSFIECVEQQKRPVVDGQQALLAMEVADRVLAEIRSHAWSANANGPVGPYPQLGSVATKAA